MIDNYFDERTLPPDERRALPCNGNYNGWHPLAASKKPSRYKRNGVIMPGQCTNGALWFS